MAGYRYWTIYITRSTVSSAIYTALKEIEMRSSRSGADRCAGGTAWASNNSSLAYRLFDNDIMTNWNGYSLNTEPTRIQYQFPSDIEIKEVAFLPSYAGQMPVDFQLHAGNDAYSYTEIGSWTDVNGWETGVWKSFNIDDLPILWPDTLPWISRDGYEHELPSEVISTDMEVGAPLVRRISRSNPWNFNVQWDMTKDQYADFFYFYNEKLNAGMKWFKFKTALPGDMGEMWGRILPGVRTRYLDDDHWVVSARMSGKKI